MFKWGRYTVGGYEVSTAGDKRFSAFNAKLRDGRSIEAHYQCDVKGYDPKGTNWSIGSQLPLPSGRGLRRVANYLSKTKQLH